MAAATSLWLLLAVVGAEDSVTSPGTDEALAMKQFHEIDTDHDGKLSREEWIAKRGSVAGFDALDLDGDGFVENPAMNPAPLTPSEQLRATQLAQEQLRALLEEYDPARLSPGYEKILEKFPGDAGTLIAKLRKGYEDERDAGRMLDEGNFDKMVMNSKEVWAVAIKSSKCDTEACQIFRAEFPLLQKSPKKGQLELSWIRVGSVNVDRKAGMGLAAKLGVTATTTLPVVMLVHGATMKDVGKITVGKIAAWELASKIKTQLAVNHNKQRESGMYLKNVEIPTKEEL